MEKVLEAVQAELKPKSSNLCAAMEYKVLQQGQKPLPEYIREVERIVDSMGINCDEDKELFKRNALMCGLRDAKIYKRCLEKGTELSYTDVQKLVLDHHKAEAQQAYLKTLATDLTGIAASKEDSKVGRIQDAKGKGNASQSLCQQL